MEMPRKHGVSLCDVDVRDLRVHMCMDPKITLFREDLDTDTNKGDDTT